MDSWREIVGKQVNDSFFHLSRNRVFSTSPKTKKYFWAAGPIIVGAGPSGLATSACLKEKGIESLVLERSDCIASLWQHKTYERLHLHLPKKHCQLPFYPFPSNFPKYPSKHQFIAYLEKYASKFDIRPLFNQNVVSAEYDGRVCLWRVETETAEYASRWLVVSTGENADAVVPEIEGMGEFEGPIVHTSLYRSGDTFRGKKVLVIGCGNSGMEICLDLCNYNAKPSIVVRDTVHILPREMLGRSTFGLSMWLLKWLPVRTADQILLLAARVTIGDTDQFGLRRPKMGPLELKAVSGKTPVLDVGTLDKIKSDEIKVIRSAINRLSARGAEFVDGRTEDFDAVIMATGYRSNVPSWLKEREFFSEKDGLPRRPPPFLNGWKGKHGLYAVGLTQKGLMGASMDARMISNDICKIYLFCVA